MGKYKCVVCDTMKRAVDELIAENMTSAGIASLMTQRGYPVGAPVVIEHRKRHYVPVAPPSANLVKRDANIIIRDKVLDALERAEDTPRHAIGKDGELVEIEFDILDKDLQPALRTAIGAQTGLNRQEAKTDDRKMLITLAYLQGGGPPPAHLLIGDGNTIEGEFEDLDVDA